MLYEYLYLKGNRIEEEYLRLFDLVYKDLFNSRPDRFNEAFDLYKLIQGKSRFDTFCEIQKDIHDILSCYRPDI